MKLRWKAFLRMMIYLLYVLPKLKHQVVDAMGVIGYHRSHRIYI